MCVHPPQDLTLTFDELLENNRAWKAQHNS